ncbi:uncharacterized protein EV420DRAFT_1650637 [Desarmillaria tabescens]|uniref:C2H2-type domain-containing protein n=1 Tax=Armillaria tabescens TaxID=1929756 RepID=A0AA39MMA8_ARMTA|nr:uncharacterized protein EV420DRAFT_1650637 [Desarmillaria tabescens]KAK0440041.1 hypothetical protein EV420DRAFT_1650637 [Desarmillaria tabescens]
MADNANVSLPSIHEMFPEHMLHVSPEVHVKGSVPPTLVPSHPYVLPQPTRMPMRKETNLYPESFPSLPRLQSSGEDDEESKKHICTVCNKRFLRPSSLNVHINTHTGATPYRCSFPGCGKEFNVKSNMFRHYRCHTGTVADQYSRRNSSPNTNPYPQINPSLTPTSTSFAAGGQYQPRDQLQDYQPRYLHDGTTVERERYYQRQYSMNDVGRMRGEEDRNHEVDQSRFYARSH